MFWFFLFRKMHGTFSPLGGIYTGLAISGRNLSLLYFLWLSNILFTALWFPFLSREGGSHSTEIPLKVVSSRTPPGPDTFMILLCRNVFNCGFFYSHLPWNLEHFPFVYLRTLLSFSRYKKKKSGSRCLLRRVRILFACCWDGFCALGWGPARSHFRMHPGCPVRSSCLTSWVLTSSLLSPRCSYLVCSSGSGRPLLPCKIFWFSEVLSTAPRWCFLPCLSPKISWLFPLEPIIFHKVRKLWDESIFICYP